MTARLKLKASQVPAGVSKPAKKRAKAKNAHPDRENQFWLLWKSCAPAGYDEPQTQFIFHETRKWRFDFAWPDQKVAVEIDGGIYQKQATGHRSISGVEKDMEKSNAAQAAGWCVLRFHAKDLDKRPKQMIEEVALTIRSRMKPQTTNTPKETQ